MTEIDWTKPIELMDGEPRDHSWPCQYDVWIHGYDGANGFWVNRSGCIGGVQVVRNRKERVKHSLYVFVPEEGRPLWSVLPSASNSRVTAPIRASM